MLFLLFSLKRTLNIPSIPFKMAILAKTWSSFRNIFGALRRRKIYWTQNIRLARGTGRPPRGGGALESGLAKFPPAAVANCGCEIRSTTIPSHQGSGQTSAHRVHCCGMRDSWQCSSNHTCACRPPGGQGVALSTFKKNQSVTFSWPVSQFLPSPEGERVDGPEADV